MSVHIAGQPLSVLTFIYSLIYRSLTTATMMSSCVPVLSEGETTPVLYPVMYDRSSYIPSHISCIVWF